MKPNLRAKVMVGDQVGQRSVLLGPLASLWRLITLAWRSWFPGPVKRNYRHRFGNGITVGIHLSTRWPKFTAIFSEPFPHFMRGQYNDFRAACVEDFRKHTGKSIRDFSNERARPLPRSIEEIEAKRHFLNQNHNEYRH